MGLVGRMARRPAHPMQRNFGEQGITLQSWFSGAVGSLRSEAGPTISVPRALGLTAVGSAVRRLSRDVGTLPLETFAGPRGNQQLVHSDPTEYMLRVRPNPAMTAQVCWTTAARHIVGWGQAFLGKEIVPLSTGDEVIGLWPIPPERVMVEIRKGVKYFHVITINKGVQTYTEREILHIFLDSHDGYEGISPIAQHRESLGDQIALSTYGAKALANRAVPTGALRIKKPLVDPGARKRLRSEWENLYKGAGNAHRIAILDEDAEFQALSIPLADAQFIEQKQYGIIEVAQIFNMPAAKLNGAVGDSLTYKTLEGNQLEYLTDALRPIISAFEGALNSDPELFPARRRMTCRFDEAALVRMDGLTRAKVSSLETAGAGWKRPSEVRQDNGLPYDKEFDYAVFSPLDPALLAELTKETNTDVPDK